MDHKLIIENFRCFRRRQEARVAPITLLMGDNSSGKSSFLAAYRAAQTIATGRIVIDFNEPPFTLGAYDQIAHFHGGTAGRAKAFTLGLSWLVDDSYYDKTYAGREAFVSLEFCDWEAQPRARKINITFDPFHAELVFKDNWQSIDVVFKKGRKEYKFSSSLQEYDWLASNDDAKEISHIFFLLDRGYLKIEPATSRKIISSLFATFRRFFWITNNRLGLHSPPKAFAPVRTHPRRTYDALKQEEVPEGDHVPQVLANSYFRKGKDGWRELKEALERFGQDSLLFKNIHVKRLGKKSSDPFQIKIGIDGPAANLIDVGYGVSQSLPLLVDIVRAPDESIFLIQQPEVHLHPRGQAELASYFSRLSKEDKKRFVIETHSDYFLDRLRLEIRKGKLIKKEDISILYFERRAGEVKISEIGLDDYGNVISAPKNYRQFFLDEERKMLG